MSPMGYAASPLTMLVIGLLVGYYQLLTMALAIVVAAVLYFLLERTRIGLAMRASVDDPELLELVDEIPLSGPGKVNRKLLREWAARQAGADPDATAGTASAGKEEESS